jgi:hypothetical protein
LAVELLDIGLIVFRRGKSKDSIGFEIANDFFHQDKGHLPNAHVPCIMGAVLFRLLQTNVVSVLSAFELGATEVQTAVVWSPSNHIAVHNLGRARILNLVVVEHRHIPFGTFRIDGGPGTHCVKDHSILHVFLSDVEMPIVVVVSSDLQLYSVGIGLDFRMVVSFP